MCFLIVALLNCAVLLKILLIYFRERVCVHTCTRCRGVGGKTKGEGDGQADHRDHGAQCRLHLTTLRSCPKPKPRVRSFTHWATQVSLNRVIFNLNELNANLWFLIVFWRFFPPSQIFQPFFSINYKVHVLLKFISCICMLMILTLHP